MTTTNMSKPTTSTTNMSKPSSTLSTSSVGKNISSLSTSTIQKAVGAKVDNSYGPQTTAAVKAFQKANGLVADGIVGPKTAAAITAAQSKTNSGGPNSGLDNSGTSVNSGPTNPIIKNQSNLVSSTDTERARLNSTGVNIDSTVNNLTGTAKFGPNGEYTYKVDSKGVPYGDPITTTTDKPKVEPTLPEGNVQDSTGNKYFTSMPKDLTYQLPTLTNGKKWVFDASGKPFEMDSTGKVTSNTVADQEYNTNVQKNKEIETQNTMYDQLKKNVSAAHQVIIDSIKQKAQEQKIAMEDLNKRYLASKTVAGFRTGSTEYTPEIAMGILKNEEEEGIRRIKEIDDNMTLKLAEAVSAKNDKDLEVAQQKFDTYSKLQKAKETAIVDQYKMYLDNQKYIADAKKSLETETRAKEDQGMQKLTATSDAYAAKYNSYGSQKAKDAYINSLAESTGLSTDTILSQIIKATPKPKEGKDTTDKEIESNKKNDIADAVLTFRELMKKNGWKGINPEQYKLIADSIRQEYGAYAVLELEKAIADAELEVDNGE